MVKLSVCKDTNLFSNNSQKLCYLYVKKAIAANMHEHIHSNLYIIKREKSNYFTASRRLSIGSITTIRLERYMLSLVSFIR